MVYAYCRKPNGNEKDTTISVLQRWLNKNDLKIDEIVFDDDVKQKASFEIRKLGTYILPKLKDGDVIIAPEVSCLGRSAIELDRLFNTVLVDKKIRIVCISMDIDVNYETFSIKSASDLRNISFAAQLHSQLAHEYTKAALNTKKSKGVKLGGASKKYKDTIAKRSKEEIKLINEKKGHSKSFNYYKSKDVQFFFDICRKVYGDEICKGDPLLWDWSQINTKKDNGARLFAMIKECKESDPSLFTKLDASYSHTLRVSVRSYLQRIQRTINSLNKWEEGNEKSSKDYISKRKNKKTEYENNEEKKQAQEMLSTFIKIDSGISKYKEHNEISSNNNGKDIYSDRMIEHDGKNEIKISEESISKFKKKK